MYAHVVRGRTRAGARADEAWQRWVADVAPLASGWRDTTGGTTAQGEVVAVTRFSSARDAQRTLSLPQHRSWWDATLAELDGEADVMESDDVTPPESVVDPSAGFVQMMMATVADRPGVERVEEEIDEPFKRWRPDLLGGYRVWMLGSRLLAVDYFTSEAEARAGERRQPPPEVAEAMPRWLEHMADVEWFDLAQSWVLRA